MEFRVIGPRDPWGGDTKVIRHAPMIQIADHGKFQVQMLAFVPERRAFALVKLGFNGSTECGRWSLFQRCSTNGSLLVKTALGRTYSV